MKSIKLYITILSGILSLSLSSCTDFLDTSSKTSLFDQNYYKTIDDAEMALVGCYDGWQLTSGGISFYLASEIMSDNCFGATGNGDGRGYQAIDRFDIGESPADANLFLDTWTNYYAGIFRCNTLLLKLDQVDWKTDDAATRNRIEGETRVLRALMYFDMVRLWENIPLLLEPSIENLPQADPADVYKVIIEDLAFAAENIPANVYPKADAAQNDGRITCYAAKALLARVYMYYTGYYGAEVPGGITKSEVLKGLEDIISSQEYDLVEEYKNLWPAASSVSKEGPNSPEEAKNYVYGWDEEKTTYAGRGNIETILAQKFNDTSDWNGNSDGNGWLKMMGLRNTDWSPYGRGWGACTVHPEIVNTFEPGDTRKTASVIDIEGEGIADAFDVADQREYTGYTVKKYTTMAYYDGKSATGGLGDFQISQSQDYVIVRYADVLLMAAELGSSDAQSHFDKVRTRAGLGSKPAIKENILAERRVEFAFEGIRYWDLLRQGIDVAAATIAEGSVPVLSGGAADKVVIKADNIKKTRGLCQIPETQITLSKGVLKQNPGW